MPFSKNRAVILAKIETEYGVDAAPEAASNAIFCEEPEIEPILKKIERNTVRQVYGNQIPIAIGEGMKITFMAEVAGSGVAGTAPHIGPLLRACGFAETVNAGVDVDYHPSSDAFNHESVTLWFYRHNLLHKVVGCRGTVKLDVKVNELGKLAFEFTGIYAGPIDGAMPAAPAYPTVVPPVFRGAALSLGGYAAVIEALSVDVGNTITRRPDANAATGILEYYIGDRKVSGSIDPEAPTVAASDFWGMMEAGTAAAFTATIGSAAGNRCVISAPKAAIDELKYADRENILTYDMPLLFTPDEGDDEIQFKFS